MDDLRKENRCSVCEAKIARRHYLTHTVLEWLAYSAFFILIALIFVLHEYGVEGLLFAMAGAISFMVMLRLIEILCTNLENTESEKHGRINKRNKKIENFYLACVIVLVAYGIYHAIRN